MRIAPTITLITLALAASAEAQQTWYVDQSGGGDFTTIQGAIQSASVQPGDEVLVRPGTYAESVVFTKDLTIASTGGRVNTIIEPRNGHAIDCRQGHVGSVTGFTISAVNCDGDYAVYCNSLMLLSNCIVRGSDHSSALATSGSAELTVQNCTFEQNNTLTRGAAFFGNGGVAEFSNCIFQDNTSSGGGGALAGQCLSASFQGCTFLRNSTSGSQFTAIYGGASALYGASFISCHFEDNAVTSSPSSGGAVFIGRRFGGLISGCTFVGNSADSAAALDHETAKDDSLLIEGCDFRRNSGQSVINSYGDGTIQILSCSFIDNPASVSVLSIQCDPYLASSPDPLVDRCTIVGSNWRGIDLGWTRASVVNCIVRECASVSVNTSASHWTGSVTYSNIEGGWPDVGNIDVDPLFADPLNWDYSLQASSPCIDTGDPNSGEDPDGTRVDMGSFFYDQHPVDADTDDDGIADVDEAFYGTDPREYDTDEDGLPDGLEVGLTTPNPETNLNFFIPDEDPLTTTDPLNPDSDGGGIMDGVEDHDRNGAVDTWDTDPNDPGDEALGVYFSGIFPGGKVHIEVWNAAPLETIIPAYSLKGPGPTPTGLGLSVDLSKPIVSMDPFLTNASGRASVDRLPIPASAPIGLPVWMQAVEISLNSSAAPRKSNPVLIPIGAN